MNIKDILPWKRKEKKTLEPVRDGGDPMPRLRDELNRVFDEFLAPHSGGRPALRSEREAFGAFAPSVDISENDKKVTVSMEIPGVDEKDVEVVLDGRRLIVRGEKKSEESDEREGRYYFERSYGAFERVIPLPDEVDEDGAKASFKKGVLKVSVPKSREAQSRRKKIEVKG